MANHEEDGTALTFPPIPLVTGDCVEVDGERKPVVAVEIVVRLADGTTRTFPLAEQHGAWWSPDAAR